MVIRAALYLLTVILVSCSPVVPTIKYGEVKHFDNGTLKERWTLTPEENGAVGAWLTAHVSGFSSDFMNPYPVTLNALLHGSSGVVTSVNVYARTVSFHDGYHQYSGRFEVQDVEDLREALGARQTATQRLERP